MNFVWTILGAILITLVLAMCITFFIVRPILARKVSKGALGLARELHGQPPLISTAASCEGVSDPDRMGLKGIGALALTEQAVVFVSGDGEHTLVIPRDKIDEAGPATSVEILGKTVRRPRPMLAVRWRNGHDVPLNTAFTLDDANTWTTAIAG